MRLPATLTATIVVATLAASLADTAPIAHAATAAPLRYGVTWTVDTATNSLSEYAPHASGSAHAIRTIKGAATGLAAPSALAVSTSGTLYVANSGNNSITEYPSGASGNTAPSHTIKGSATGLAGPSSITLSGGELWVTNPTTNLVEAFTAGSGGNELPAETIAGHKTLLNHPVGVAVDNEAEDLGIPSDEGLGTTAAIYVINAPTSKSGNITAYSTEKLGNVAPQARITSTQKHPLRSPSAILSVGFGALWVADAATDTISNLVVLPQYEQIQGLPGSRTLRTIAGSATRIDAPSGLSFDALDHLVVANAGDHSIRLFAANAVGNVAPIRTLSGLGTATGNPAAAVVLGTRPGRPTDFQVTVHRYSKSANATLSWQPPALTGGGILGYQVIVFRTSSIDGILSVIGFSGVFGDIGGTGVTTRHTTYTKKNLKLGHSYLFAVEAVNAFGSSNLSRPKVRTFAIAASAPQKVSASSGKHSVSVHWLPPAHNGGRPVTAYRVEYGTCVPGSKGCKFHSRVLPRNRDFVKIGGLKAGATYDVRVLAKTHHGLGAPSKTVTATALA